MKFIKFVCNNLLVITIGFSSQGMSFNNLNIASPTVVKIKDQIRLWNPDNPPSCELAHWANQMESSCECCLIKAAKNLDSRSAHEIINECSAQGQCNQATIDGWLAQENSAADQDKESRESELITTIFNNAMVIKNVVPTGISLNHQGYFSEESAKQFLAEAFKQKALANANFSSSSCLQAKDYLTARGYQTLQLFIVSATCQKTPAEFIFKEIASKIDEPARLVQSSMVLGLDRFIYPHKVSGFPTFFFPVAYLSYSYDGQTHYLSIAPKADGLVMIKYMEKYKNNEISKDRIKDIYYKSGLELSRFHKEFMPRYRNDAEKNILTRTITHGDLHQANALFDEKTGGLNLIDNERIAQSTPGDPKNDVIYFFYVTLSHFTPSHLLEDHAFLSDWLNLTMHNFLSGYADAYPQAQRKQVISELYNDFIIKSDYNKYKQTIDEVFDVLMLQYSSAR